MKAYYNFGGDKKYLKGVEIKIVEDNRIDNDHYNPKEKIIYIQKSSSDKPNVIAHEQSHAIIDTKYEIWDKITNRFYKKYEDEYNDILRTVTNEMKDELNKAFDKANKKSYELLLDNDKMKIIENTSKTEFGRECLKDVYRYLDLYKSLNTLSKKVAKRFGEEYGDKTREFVLLLQEINGLDELLAHAVGEQVLGGDVIYYKGSYLFEGSGTIYKLWKMLKENSYSYVADKLFSQISKRAKKLITEI